MNLLRMPYLPMAKACLSIFRIKTAEGLQYRMAAFAGAATSIFWALIEITVYSIFYKYAANRDAGLIAGLSLKQVVSYIWLAQVLWLMQSMSIDNEILNKITSGDVGIELCRPFDLYLHWFAKNAASRLVPLSWLGAMVLLFGMIMPLSYRLSLPETFQGFIFTLVSVFSAFLLCTAFAMLICVIRMSIAWGDGPTYIMILVGGVLSGAYLPLQLWPKFMQGFLLTQPFAGYLDIPLRLYLGTMKPGDAGWVIGLQLLWAAVFMAAGKALMNRRLKNIIVQGG